MGHQYPFPTKYLWYLYADFSLNTDQPFNCGFTATPPVDTRSGLYVVTGVFFQAHPGDGIGVTTPQGGIFDGPAGTGNAIVLGTQVWSNAYLFVPKLNSAICPDPYVGGAGGANILTAANPPRLFLTVTGSGHANIYIVGFESSTQF